MEEEAAQCIAILPGGCEGGSRGDSGGEGEGGYDLEDVVVEEATGGRRAEDVWIGDGEGVRSKGKLQGLMYPGEKVL